MKGILCFGEALIDFHALPAADAHTPPAFQPHAGGAPANVAVGVARLGGPAVFVGMLGRDMFADMLLAELDDAGVDVSHVARTDAANTALAFVSHDAHGERSFSFYRPPSADLLFRDVHFDAVAFEEAGIFHACSNSLTEPEIAAATLAGMRRAREAGAMVTFDMNLRPALWPRDTDPTPRLWEALDAADLVKLSAEELAFLAASAGGEDAAIERLWHHHAQLLVVTDGGNAMRWLTPTRQGSLAPFTVRAVDTTAAGDAFVGGLLYGLALRGVDTAGLPALATDDAERDAWLCFAAACGALAVTRAGAFAAMPTRAEVQAFLESHA